jgi:hypothetical protein
MLVPADAGAKTLSVECVVQLQVARPAGGGGETAVCCTVESTHEVNA